MRLLPLTTYTDGERSSVHAVGLDHLRIAGTHEAESDQTFAFCT